MMDTEDTYKYPPESDTAVLLVSAGFTKKAETTGCAGGVPKDGAGKICARNKEKKKRRGTSASLFS